MKSESPDKRAKNWNELPETLTPVEIEDLLTPAEIDDLRKNKKESLEWMKAELTRRSKSKMAAKN